MARGPFTLKTAALRFDTVQVFGGLDLLNTTISRPPGSLTACSNFRALSTGGYARIAGYERYDGTALPSTAVFTTVGLPDSLPTTPTSVVDQSGVSHTVLGVDGNELYLYGDVTSAVPAGSTIIVDGVGYVVQFSVVDAAAQPATQARMKAAAADILRGSVTGIPTGAIHGIVPTDTSILAVSTGAVYEATSAGWSEVIPVQQLDVSNVTTAIAAGSTITGATSGATAVVDKVLLVYGDGSTATPGVGTLLVSSVVGAFTPGENLTVAGAVVGVADSDVIQPYPATSGKINSTLHNFYGTAGYTSYFVDGVSPRIFVFDGALYSVPLNTPSGATRLTAHASRLVVASESSIFLSAAGEPLVFDAVVGAAEVACGAGVTALQPYRGSSSSHALVVGTDSGVSVLYGTDASTWRLDSVTTGTGVLPDCAVFVGDDVLFASPDGIRSLRGVNAFGNFSVSLVSTLVKPIYDLLADKLITAVPVPNNNECRFVCSNGQVISCTRSTASTGAASGPVYEFMVFDYATSTGGYLPVSCYTAFTRRGATLHFAASGNLAYAFDSGASFDGGSIVAYLVFNYTYSKYVGVRKRYKRAKVFVESQGYSEISMAYDTSVGSSDSLPAYKDATSVFSSAKLFDAAVWDRFVWSLPSLPYITVDSPAAGEAYSLMVKHDSTYSDPFTVKSFVLEFTLGRTGRN